MTNLLKTAADYLRTKMETHASEPVAYERPGLGVVDGPEDFGKVMAVCGQTQAPQELIAAGVISERSVQNDFTIRRSLLVINGVTIEPESGDLIIHDTAGYRLTYCVSSEGGLSVADPSDPYGVAIRVHCDLTNIEVL